MQTNKKCLGKAKLLVKLLSIKEINPYIQHSQPVDLWWLLLATSMVSGKYLHKTERHPNIKHYTTQTALFNGNRKAQKTSDLVM